MIGECPELKKKLKKEKFTFKKAKAMLATWSDEDEDEDAQEASGDEEIQCLMARSDDSNEKRKIEATTEIFRNHFSLACSPQSEMGIVYVKHRTNRMRINFSPRLSNNKGWTGCLFFVGQRKGANIPEWDFPVRVVEPLRKADMAPFLIQGAAAASQSLNTAGVNHAEGYLTEYKLMTKK
ncbi:hypothetical protein Taro_010504 [Colocasia esculenta]|uniref:Uncharacterized protein n=1 Tax=Colocasia esculenta TaxID=4460 RepID=A0A843TZ37_COLES|nr:hypothetical protein [Colocasia esculenta]